MNEFIEKLISRLEKEEEYQLKKADECEQKQAFEMISVSKSRRKNAQCFDVAIQVVNQLVEEYNNDFCEHTLGSGVTSCGKIFRGDSESGKCPYCGKKIKVVEPKGE